MPAAGPWDNGYGGICATRSDSAEMKARSDGPCAVIAARLRRLIECIDIGKLLSAMLTCHVTTITVVIR